MSRISLSIPYHTSCLRLLMVLLAVAALPLGCAKVQPEPFAKFSATMDMGQKGIEYAMTATAKVERDALIRSLALDPDSYRTMTGYKYIREPNSFNLSSPQYSDSTLMMIVNLNEKIGAMNAALKRYAQLLFEISANATIDDNKVKDIENDLNAAVKAAQDGYSTSGSTLPGELSQPITFALSRLFQDLTRGYQRKILVDAINKNQKMFELYCQVCKQYADLFYSAYYDHAYCLGYDDQHRKLKDIDAKLLKTPDDIKLQAKRKAIVTALINKDIAMYNTMLFTKQLDQFYTILPTVHKELGENLKKGMFDFSSGERLMMYAQKMYEGYAAFAASVPAQTPAVLN